MINPEYRIVVLLGGFFILSALANAESIDPRSPAEWHTQLALTDKPVKKWLPARISQLEAQREQLVAQIEKLPQHKPIPLTVAYGFHSTQNSPDIEGKREFHHLTADFVFNNRLNSIGLVPAFDPLDPLRRTYGFPKRFKVEVLPGSGHMENGVWIQSDSAKWVDVVNWMDEDFPDPGPYPVVFSDIDRNVSKLRVSVPKCETGSGAGFFALGEVYLFRTEEGQIADNMSVFGNTGISFTASDSLSVLPVWDLEYVYDGVSGLGLPLSEKKTDAEDFVVRFDGESMSREPVRIILDLGEEKRIGRIEIWPTQAVQNMVVPLFGFPGKVLAELSNEPDFKETFQVEAVDARSLMHNDNLLTLICVGQHARYIRLSFDNLREFMGSPILGVGEISVLEFGKVLSVGCEVFSEGIPEASVDQLPRLVDGFSRQRRILPESDWIIGLAKRRPLDFRLNQVEQELVAAKEDLRHFLVRMGVLGGCFFLFLMISGWGFQRRQRRQELNKLKVQITRDLHDEVGSSLGSISLASEELESMALDDAIKEELGELSLMAREANASLREVVWMTDQITIRLPALIEKLVERVERVLRDVVVREDISPDCPDIEVSLMVKRHIIMFFKEAVHNCARHAAASQVWVKIAIDDEDLHISIADNGCGFDTSKKQEGWGLTSMKKRASELGGKLEIESRVGEGTQIRLIVPCLNLSIVPASLYKTSN